MYPLRLLSRPVAAIRFCPSGPVGNVSDDNIFFGVLDNNEQREVTRASFSLGRNCYDAVCQPAPRARHQGFSDLCASGSASPGVRSNVSMGWSPHTAVAWVSLCGRELF